MVIACIRTILLYFLIIAGIRLMGKRQIGELEPSELVLALLISDLAVVPMQDFGIPLLTGIIPIVCLLCVSMILSILTVRHVKLRSILCGRPSIVVENGTICQMEMKKNRFTVDELMGELRLQSITDVAAVKYAILETNGRLSVLPYANHNPVTADQAGFPTVEGGLPIVIINDGRVLSQNLYGRGFDDIWLNHQLQARGLSSTKDVYLFTVDECERIYFAPKVVDKPPKLVIE